MQLADIKITPLLETLQLLKITDEVYFSSEYKDYISNSRLGLLNPKQDGSPEKFFTGFVSDGYISCFELGSAVHELYLQSDYFTLAPDMQRPSAKLGAIADYLYPKFLNHKKVTKQDILEASNVINYYKDKMTDTLLKNVITKCEPYWKQRKKYKEDTDKVTIYLDSRTRDTVYNCVLALKANKQIDGLVNPEAFLTEPISENEWAILLDVKAECPNGKSVILHLKSKLDNFTIEDNVITVNDVKTIGKVLSEASNNIIKFHYNREIAMYAYLLKLYVENFKDIKNPEIKGNFLWVSTIPHYYTKVTSLTKEDFIEGFHEFKTLLKYAAYLMVYKNYNF